MQNISPGNSGVVVERLVENDVEPASRTLANSFADNAFFQWLMGPRPDYERRLLPLFRSILKIELSKSHHLVDIVDDGAGVAVWYDVDQWSPSKWDQTKMLPAAVKAYGTRLAMAGKVKSMVDAVHPSEPHRHLALIGVRQDRQGSGLGSILMAAATDRCDADGVPAYLENLNPRNAPLYHRFGFVDRGSIPLPDGAPPMTAMWRDPR